jgi:hypothetical protein
MADNNANSYYTFAAKATPWPNDTIPPNIDNSVATIEQTINSEMLFGKYIPDGYSNLMTNRYDWTSGTVYAAYDDQDVDLFTKQFFVLTNEAGGYHVFKCLNNNNGAASTQQPLLSETAADDVYYSTADNYQWKYMYSFNTTSYDRFATSSYIPVLANTYVAANAVSGAIETYKIVSPGGNYNSYTNGYFTDIAVGGNTQYFGIQGTDTTILTVSSNTYTIGETITQLYGGVTANGVLVSYTTANSTAVLLTLKNVNNIFSPTLNTISGGTSGKISTVSDVTSPDVSSNNGFYTGCSLYIIAGTGAGQVGTIAEYLVIGNTRRVLLANSFATLPDLSSKYIISPRVSITGDGTGAAALSIIDPNTKQLTDIRVIDRGSGYTYANVAVFGNTGSTAIASNNAVVRAILPPRGGHGYEAESELNATFLCYSTTFVNTESGKLPGTGSKYRRVGLIVNPQYSNVLVSYTNTYATAFSAGQKVTGSISNARGIINASYTANTTLKLSNTVGVFQSGDVLTTNTTNSSINAVATTVTGAPSVFDNRTQLICPSATLVGGTFSIGQKIVQVDGGVDLGYAYIQDLQTSGANTYIYLTEVKGYFQSSDTPTNTYKYIYDDATRQVRIEVDTIIQSDIVPYTGDVLYVENIEPVTRNSTQSETVKLIYGFN